MKLQKLVPCIAVLVLLTVLHAGCAAPSQTSSPTQPTQAPQPQSTKAVSQIELPAGNLPNLENLTLPPIFSGARLAAESLKAVQWIPASTSQTCSAPEIPSCPKDGVAILVIDDFCTEINESAGKQIVRPDETLQGLMKDKNCVFTPDGQTHFSSSGVLHYASDGANWGLLSLPGVSHGDLVMGDLKALVNKRGLQEKVCTVPVATTGYTSYAVTQGIKEAMAKLEEAGVSQFVLNMSFVIRPCEADLINYDNYVDQLGKTEWRDVRGLVTGLANDAAGTEPTEDPTAIGRLLFAYRPEFAPARLWAWSGGDNPILPDVRYQPDNSQDPVIRFLNTDLPEEATKGRRVISVAAAGNSKRPFPFAPAAWDSVLSITAEPASDKRPGLSSAYANAGEVMLSGKYAYNVPEGSRFNGNDVSGELTLYGTSFAAPEFSVWAAEYLLNGGPIPCPDPNTDDAVGETNPPLKYYPNLGKWDNLDLATAAKTYCTGFPSSP
jgi:hypothetical protein